jgi:hypothetical protein
MTTIAELRRRVRVAKMHKDVAFARIFAVHWTPAEEAAWMGWRALYLAWKDARRVLRAAQRNTRKDGK